MRAAAITALAAAALALAACEDRSERTVSTSNGKIPVDLLFEIDGCKVYRFQPNPFKAAYFANCARSTTLSYDEDCGKNCEQPMMVTSTKEGGAL